MWKSKMKTNHASAQLTYWCVESHLNFCENRAPPKFDGLDVSCSLYHLFICMRICLIASLLCMHIYIYINNTHIHVYIYIYIYLSVCVCMHLSSPLDQESFSLIEGRDKSTCRKYIALQERKKNEKHICIHIWYMYI